VDLKANREAGNLEVKGVWFEEDHNTDEVAAALASALFDLVYWVDLENVQVFGRGRLHVALRSCLSAVNSG